MCWIQCFTVWLLMNFLGDYGYVKYYYWIKGLEKGGEYKYFIRNKIIIDNTVIQ